MGRGLPVARGLPPPTGSGSHGAHGDGGRPPPPPGVPRAASAGGTGRGGEAGAQAGGRASLSREPARPGPSHRRRGTFKLPAESECRAADALGWAPESAHCACRDYLPHWGPSVGPGVRPFPFCYKASPDRSDRGTWSAVVDCLICKIKIKTLAPSLTRDRESSSQLKPAQPPAASSQLSPPVP
jgi:hypothetical protein